MLCVTQPGIAGPRASCSWRRGAASVPLSLPRRARPEQRSFIPRAIATAPRRDTPAPDTIAPADLERQQRDEQAPQPQQEQQASFDWGRQWYPVAMEADLETSRPNAIQLLGKQMAVWRDDDGWHAVQDQCPHRLAALSDGHVSSKGDIVCPYHGWEFNAEGKCTHNPQALDEAAERTACASSRSRVAAYPVRAAQGVLWAWGAAGSEEFIHSAAKPLPIAEEAEDGAWFSLPYGFSQYNAIDYTVMIENSFDPSHSNYVHGGTFQARKDAIAMKAKLKTDIDPVDGFKVDHGAYSRNQKGLQVERHFIPPCTLRATYKTGPVTQLFMVHLTPLAPGISRSFFKLCIQPSAKPNWKVQLMNKIPKPSWLAGLTHVASNKAADQDMLVLHRQDQRLRRAMASQGKRRGWRQYYMATPSDVAVDAYRRWLDMAGGAPPYEGDQPYPPEKSLLELQDRWGRHTAHCKECQKTIGALGQITQALGVAAWVFGIAAIWLAGAAAVGSSALGHGFASQQLLGIPVSALAAAAAAGCQLLSSRAAATRKQFHVPERLPSYPLNNPGV